ncbi:hypothetical protein ACA910_012956 [Epithemia clementina (nom. ined.)]
MTLHHSADHTPNSKSACLRHMKTRSKTKGHRRSAFRIYSAAIPSCDNDKLVLQKSDDLSILNCDSNKDMSPEEFCSSSEWAHMTCHIPTESAGSRRKPISNSPWKSIACWTQVSCRNDVRPRPGNSSPSTTNLIDAQLRQLSLA